jgi:excisionase family DNA binding protein
MKDSPDDIDTPAPGWDDPLYSVPEVAQLLRCGRTTVFELLRDGQLAGVRIGRKRLVSGRSLRDLVRRLDVAARGEA